MPASFAHACLAALKSRLQIDDCTHDAGRCDANELQQPLSCNQHLEQSRSAGQSATSLLQHSCHCCQLKSKHRPPKIAFLAAVPVVLYLKLSSFGQARS